jgi:hypothetical protein
MPTGNVSKPGKMDGLAMTWKPLKASFNCQSVILSQATRAKMEARKYKLRQPFEGREALMYNTSWDDFTKAVKARKLPVGATWVAALGTVYGPARA